MRLYHAICAWIEAHAQALRDGDTDHPEGDNATQAELGDVMPLEPELHAGHRGQSIDDDNGARNSRPISLRWTPPATPRGHYRKPSERT